MKKHHAFVLSLAMLSLFACKNPADGKPKAEVSSPASLAAASPAAAAEPSAKAADAKAPHRIALNAANTSLVFVGSKVTGSHEGRFEQLSGAVETLGTDPASAKISVSIDMASVKSGIEKLDGHLKSPDFFNVEKFPTARFDSIGIAAAEASKNVYTITGNLLLHGVTRQISFPATIAVSEQNVDVKSEFSINRRDFDIVYPGMPDDLIRDDVLIELKMNLAR